MNFLNNGWDYIAVIIYANRENKFEIVCEREWDLMMLFIGYQDYLKMILIFVLYKIKLK